MPADLQVNAANLQFAVADGRIVGLGEQPANEVLDVPHLQVLPGLIDSHVHFNDPGTDWEGFASGSRACAAGGITSFFDMPLNSIPGTTTREAFEQKRQAAERDSLVDFGLWGGVIPGNLDQLRELDEAGAIGFKAFLCDSGLAEFPATDPANLEEAMARLAGLDQVLALHAEYFPEPGLHCESPVTWSATRPVERELEAIGLAIDAAEKTGCRVHIVHVSHPRCVELIDEARARVDISCETCPHYLLLNELDTSALGAVAKCAPPLRSEEARLGLSECLKAGTIDTVGSDHSPCTPEMKVGAWDEIWGGISSVQFMLPLLLEATDDLEQIAGWCGRAPAERFRLPQKGTLEEGADADFVLVDGKAQTAVSEDAIRYRHTLSPYLGRSLPGRVEQSYVRGNCVFKRGGSVTEFRGQLLRPERNCSR